MVFDVDLFIRLARVSGLPIQALASSGGRYYPLRGSTWTTQQNSGEGNELLLRWIRLRADEWGSDTTLLAWRALAKRARAAGRRDRHN